METKTTVSPLAEAIRKKGAVQRVADELGVTRGAVYKWINGGVPDKDRMNEVCRYLGISPNQIYGYNRNGR